MEFGRLRSDHTVFESAATGNVMLYLPRQLIGMEKRYVINIEAYTVNLNTIWLWESGISQTSGICK